MQAVSDAAEEAVTKGFLLPSDAELIKAAAGLQWDLLVIKNVKSPDQPDEPDALDANPYPARP